MPKVEKIVRKLLKKAERYDREYLNGAIKAVELCERPEQAATTIERFLSQGGKRCHFAAVNPYAKKQWLEAVLRAFLESAAIANAKPVKGFGNIKTCLPVAMLTITDAGWMEPDSNIQFDLRRAQQKVRNAFRSVDMLGAFEVAVYTNETVKKNGKLGRLVSFHAHLVVWAGSLSTIKRRCRKVERRFKGMLGKKHGLHIRRLDTLDEAAKAIRYVAKLPAYGKRTRVTPRGKRQQDVPIPRRTRYRVFSHLRDYKVGDLWIGSGRGAEILKKARADVYGDEAYAKMKRELLAKALPGRRKIFGRTSRQRVLTQLAIWEAKRKKS